MKISATHVFTLLNDKFRNKHITNSDPCRGHPLQALKMHELLVVRVEGPLDRKMWLKYMPK